MKKFIKNNIVGFILGAIIFTGITSVAAYTIFADNIGYTPSDTTWKKSNGEDITNVKDAIDELYFKANNEIKTVYFITFANSNDGFYYLNYQDYKYFKITETEIGTSTSISIKKWNWSNNGESTILSLNTKYEITTDNEQVVIQPNSGHRNIKIEFYKN